MNAMADFEAQSQDYDSKEDVDQEHQVAFCMSDDKNITVNEGHLLSQEGGIVDSVTTNSFNKKRAPVILNGAVDLDSMSSVDVFGNDDSQKCQNGASQHENSLQCWCGSSHASGHVSGLWRSMVSSGCNSQHTITQ